jgi:hypothetical protein
MFAPRLMTAQLIRGNVNTRAKARRRIAAAAAFGLIIAIVWAQRAGVAQAIDWLRLHGPLWGGLAAVASAIQVARRRVLKRAEFAGSWLAAVPVRASTARWEALLIETLPATAALAAMTVLALSCGLVLAFAHAGRSGALFAVWAAASAGIAIGALASYAMPAPKPVDLPPGSRYVPHAKLHRAAEIRPSLTALGAWPVRQMFAWAQPKMVARATILILVMMPLGTTADVAMVVIAVFAVTGALILLWMAAVSASRWVRRWMAPLPVHAGAVMRALLLPTFGVMAGASAVEAALLLALGVSYRGSAAAGIVMAVVGCLATLGGVQLWGAWPRRVP